MKCEHDIKARIDELKRANASTNTWLQEEKTKQPDMQQFRQSAIYTYNTNLKLIKLLEWVLQ
jgi:predicted transcriptional regulator